MKKSLYILSMGSLESVRNSRLVTNDVEMNFDNFPICVLDNNTDLIDMLRRNLLILIVSSFTLQLFSSLFI